MVFISRWVANSVQSRGTNCRVFRKLLVGLYYFHPEVLVKQYMD